MESYRECRSSSTEPLWWEYLLPILSQNRQDGGAAPEPGLGKGVEAQLELQSLTETTQMSRLPRRRAALFLLVHPEGGTVQ